MKRRRQRYKDETATKTMTKRLTNSVVTTRRSYAAAENDFGADSDYAGYSCHSFADASVNTTKKWTHLAEAVPQT